MLATTVVQCPMTACLIPDSHAVNQHVFKRLSEPVMRVIHVIKDDEKQGVVSVVISIYHAHHRFGQSF